MCVSDCLIAKVKLGTNVLSNKSQREELWHSHKHIKMRDNIGASECQARHVHH